MAAKVGFTFGENVIEQPLGPFRVNIERSGANPVVLTATLNAPPDAPARGGVSGRSTVEMTTSWRHALDLAEEILRRAEAAGVKDRRP